MLKTLVKKQLTEVFRNYFYNAKKNAAKSKRSTIVSFLYYAAVMCGILGVIFYKLGNSLCESFLPLGLDWLFFLLMSGISILLGVFGSVFSTYSSLYLAKDNDFLFSMPIPVHIIIASRLINVYILGVTYSMIVIVPASIAYFLHRPVTFANVIGNLVVYIGISVIVMVLSCLLGWVVAKLSLKLKNKSYITVAVSILFIAGYYAFTYKAQEILENFIDNASAYGEHVRGSLGILYAFGSCGAGDYISIIITLCTCMVLSVLTYILLSKSFLKLATSTVPIAQAKNARITSKQSSISLALLKRELSHFTSSANYMLNCGMGILVIPLAGIALLIKGPVLMQTLTQVFGNTDLPIVLVIAILMMMTSMNDMATPSVSLEGKSLWIIQSLPFHPWQVLKAKIQMQVLLTGIPFLITIICILCVLPCSFLQGILLILILYTFIVMNAEFDLILGLLRPNFDWSSEIYPIKQNLSVLFAIIGSWIFPAVFGGIYLFANSFIGAVGYMAIFLLLFLILTYALYHWLKTKGSQKLAAF